MAYRSQGALCQYRVQEKYGSSYQWTTQGVEVPLMHEVRVGTHSVRFHLHNALSECD